MSDQAPAIPATSDPWHVVEHEGVRYRVRTIAGGCWVSRISDGAVWFFAPVSDAPAWAVPERARSGQAQLFD